MFRCVNCGINVSGQALGTRNRNHCPKCLWSKHVDAKTGDRKSRCGGKMTPVGLTFKRVTPDKYKGEKRGELMLVHRCLRCGKVSINRIAGDDSAEEILKLLDSDFAAEGVEVLGRNNRTEVRRQLFGS